MKLMKNHIANLCFFFSIGYVTLQLFFYKRDKYLKRKTLPLIGTRHQYFSVTW